MILFRYTKTDGAEYIPHLDLIRHIDRIFRRMGIYIRVKGMGNHPCVYNNNPLSLGVRSFAEYCVVDADPIEGFIECFNANAPKGIRCLAYEEIEKDVNLPVTIVSCRYRLEGISAFDANEVLSEQAITVTDKKNREVDIRPRILDLQCEGESCVATLCTGTNTLRPDVLGDYLSARFGGRVRSITKEASFTKQGTEILKTE